MPSEYTLYQGSARKRCANSRKQKKIELQNFVFNGALLLLSRALLLLDRALLTPANLNWTSYNDGISQPLSRALLLLDRVLLKPRLFCL